MAKGTSTKITKKQLTTKTVKEIQDLLIQNKLSHLPKKYVRNLILAKLRNHKTGLGPFLIELRRYCCGTKKDEKIIEKIFSIFSTVVSDMEKNVAKTTGSTLDLQIMSIQEIWIKERLNEILSNSIPVEQGDVMVVYSNLD